MNKNKFRAYLIPGLFLVFVGLRDLDDFNPFYEGIALALGIVALVMAVITFMNDTKDEEQS